MNNLNTTLFAAVKVWIYLLILIGMIGILAVFVVIPGWIRTEEALVPSIIGENYYEAVRILGDAGLQPAKTLHEASSDAPKGEIVSQNPQPNFRIKSYQPVEITVSIGAKLEPVPSVIGKSRESAFETLVAAGFRPNRVAFVHSADYLEDTIIAQTPTEGGGQRRGSPVNLLVSRGPRPQVIQLPDFQGQPAADIVPRLETVGLKIETEYSSHPKIPHGAVITHEPAGGRTVKTGDRILLEISGVQGVGEDISKPLPFKHKVSAEGKRSRRVKIIVIDDYSERIEVDQHYAPGTVVDLEQKGVRVFGKARVIVYENGKKLPEVLYR